MASWEGLMADGTLVGPTRGWGSWWVGFIGGGGGLDGGFTMAGFVATNGLVGREGFVAYR